MLHDRVVVIVVIIVVVIIIVIAVGLASTVATPGMRKQKETNITNRSIEPDPNLKVCCVNANVTVL